MTDLTLSRSPDIIHRDLARRDLAPGLLQVLQQAVALRFLLGLLSAIMAAALAISGRMPEVYVVRWVLVYVVLESTALLVMVLVPAFRGWLGAWFLPVTLGWILLAPLVQQGLTLVLAEGTSAVGTGVVAVGLEAVWLAIPVVLAAWQYGRRGWRVSMAVLFSGYVLLGMLVGSDLALLSDYVLITIGRLGMVALLGYVVMRLVTALQGEQEALVEANRQLARRAATVEQLTEIRERNRLARELHDTLAHSLTGLSVQLQALGTLMAHDSAAAAKLLEEAQATVRNGTRESRRAIQALRATPLEDLGLTEALRQLCRQYADRTGLAFTCDLAEVQALDPLTEQALYRVASAALANVEQHAAASTVSVRLARLEEDRLRLSIKDDGVGFDMAAVPKERYGLAGMRERAALIGATLQIDSVPGQGTEILLQT